MVINVARVPQTFTFVVKKYTDKLGTTYTSIFFRAGLLTVVRHVDNVTPVIPAQVYTMLLLRLRG